MGFLPRRGGGRRFSAVIVQDDNTSGCFIWLPLSPKAVFGKARAPVAVTINGHLFRTTTFTMGGRHFIPLNRGNRDAAGVGPGDRVDVVMAADAAPRVVKAPADLSHALDAAGATAAWSKLSYTHQREHVEAIDDAKKPETRARRIARCVDMLGAR
jgi:hypothetical protein